MIFKSHFATFAKDTGLSLEIGSFLKLKKHVKFSLFKSVTHLVVKMKERTIFLKYF